VPELPDVVLYVEALEKRIVNQELRAIRVTSPFLVRTADPPIQAAVGKRVRELRRLGKRIAIGFEADLWLVVHLMIAGRLHWREASSPAASRAPSGKQALAAFDFASGCLLLTEAGSKKRAALHAVQGEAGLRELDAGGADVLAISLDQFGAALTAGNHTLKRALTDPRLFSGIGNAYSDEILHRARLSPVALTSKLTPAQISALYDAARETLSAWIARLRAEAGGCFPEKVTAFRDGMAVHGRYRQPCPECGTAVQRIRYAENETNYCPSCQTGGKLLADRALSRLLRQDWPRTVEELETARTRR
jgi:formamidopyrimidine-DNA glycosylase